MKTKQELMNELAKFQRLQDEQPDRDYSAVINQIWREIHEALEQEFSTSGVRRVRWPR